MSVKRALLSVSDRTGLVDLASALARHGFTLLSTGGTAAHLEASGLTVSRVEDVTGFPEIFGGRVKTLHPKVFGGILMNAAEPLHVTEAASNAIDAIDVVVVNLYPFEETVASGASAKAVIEKIDVGGPSLLRAAAKNHARVAVVCDPRDYPSLVEELDRTGGLGDDTRRELAAKAFRRTADYDAAIAGWFDGARALPAYEKRSGLRYGENPHQQAAFFLDPAAARSAFARFVVHQGKELSYNNLLDADAALFASRSVGNDTLTIVKHRIATGIALDARLAAAFEAAWACDPVAGFGGVVAYTGTLDAEGAALLTSRFLEVVLAHALTDEARSILGRKPTLRVLTVEPDAGRAPYREHRGVDGGLLVQDADVDAGSDSGVGAEWRVVTRRAPDEAERAALHFAERAVRGVLSNAIVVTGERATLGIGGGRTSRVDACRDAVQKAGERARGAVAGSDAFFPFPDGLEVLADAGVTAIVQPGGSVKDAEVIAAADARGLAMVMTGKRHFRH